MKKIEKPKINFPIAYSDEFYLENDLIIIINNNCEEKFYLTKEGISHRLDGPSHSYCNNVFYYIHGQSLSVKEFVKETKHLICKYCQDFCKQKCFI